MDVECIILFHVAACLEKMQSGNTKGRAIGVSVVVSRGIARYASTAPFQVPVLSRAVIRETEESLGCPVVALPTLGGRLPMYTFESALHASRRYVSPAKYQ